MGALKASDGVPDPLTVRYVFLLMIGERQS